MNKRKIPLFIIAMITTFSIMGIGVSIGLRSYIGGFICIIVFMLLMGFGFRTKKKLRDEGHL